MGSYALQAEDSRDEINVFVTGFGPFLDFETNPAYLIASTLPKTLRPAHGPRINIHAHSKPLQVAYSHVRSTIPHLIFSDDASRNTSRSAQPQPLYDLILHIGLAHNRTFYTLETLAHRDGYNRRDINDQTMADDTLWKNSYESPEILHSSFDTEDVWRRWKAGLTGEDIRPSNDPGRYLCDFVYYTSMVEYWRRETEGRRPVMFLHVPAGYGEEEVERGRRVAVGLIEALVGSLIKRKDGEGG